MKRKHPFLKEIMMGLDDVAHNRLFLYRKGKKLVKVKNYGKRSPKYKCFCKQLKRLERDDE